MVLTKDKLMVGKKAGTKEIQMADLMAILKAGLLVDYWEIEMVEKLVETMDNMMVAE